MTHPALRRLEALAATPAGYATRQAQWARLPELSTAALEALADHVLPPPPALEVPALERVLAWPVAPPEPAEVRPAPRPRLAPPPAPPAAVARLLAPHATTRADELKLPKSLKLSASNAPAPEPVPAPPPRGGAAWHRPVGGGPGVSTEALARLAPPEGAPPGGPRRSTIPVTPTPMEARLSQVLHRLGFAPEAARVDADRPVVRPEEHPAVRPRQHPAVRSDGRLQGTPAPPGTPADNAARVGAVERAPSSPRWEPPAARGGDAPIPSAPGGLRGMARRAEWIEPPSDVRAPAGRPGTPAPHSAEQVGSESSLTSSPSAPGATPERTLPERTLPERALPERALAERALAERALAERLAGAPGAVAWPSEPVRVAEGRDPLPDLRALSEAELAARLGRILAREARRHGIDLALGEGGD